MIGNVARADALLMAGTDGSDPVKLHIPKSDEFVLSPSGLHLHMHSHWPCVKPRGLVLSLHGYGSHGNRPTHKLIAETINSLGLIYTTLDFAGHGYSEGDRALVSSAQSLVDDGLAALVAFYSPGGGNKKQQHIRRELPNGGVPLFLMGHSMGGGITLLIADILEHGADAKTRSPVFLNHRSLFENTLMPCFRGAILISPLVSLGKLRYAHPLVATLGALFPSSSLPTWLVDENDGNSKVWTSPNYRRYIEFDGYPHSATGLSYGGNIRFSTLASLLNLCNMVRRSIVYSNFPFIILHDEDGDVVLPSSGTAMLMELSPSDHKTCVRVTGGRHDPPANTPDAVLGIIAKWLYKMIS